MVVVMSTAQNFVSVLICVACIGAQVAHGQKPDGASVTAIRMADGKQWTPNLNVAVAGSYCVENSEANCRRYGRLYTWEAAQQACKTLGNGWRLPTDDEWQQMAKHHGGIFEESKSDGKATFAALMNGGKSGFNAVLGGNRSNDGKYERVEAHGFYWTATENGSASAVFYNFGKGSGALYRQPTGEKTMPISARCVRD
jgi:uncharacterized protein (TIGR02145 family)